MDTLEQILNITENVKEGQTYCLTLCPTVRTKVLAVRVPTKGRFAGTVCVDTKDPAGNHRCCSHEFLDYWELVP